MEKKHMPHCKFSGNRKGKSIFYGYMIDNRIFKRVEIKSRRLAWLGHVERKEDDCNLKRIEASAGTTL